MAPKPDPAGGARVSVDGQAVEVIRESGTGQATSLERAPAAHAPAALVAKARWRGFWMGLGTTAAVALLGVGGMLIYGAVKGARESRRRRREAASRVAASRVAASRVARVPRRRVARSARPEGAEQA